jgi:hypothetical protein
LSVCCNGMIVSWLLSLNTFCQGYEHEHNSFTRKTLFPQPASAVTAFLYIHFLSSSTSSKWTQIQLPPLLYYGNGAPPLQRNLTLSRVAMHPVDYDKPSSSNQHTPITLSKSPTSPLLHTHSLRAHRNPFETP